MKENPKNGHKMEYPAVSVIVPCRNEGAYIQPCLDSITKNEYPSEKLEILVVDGMSDDETRAHIKAYASENKQVRLIDNPKRITSAALNLGIKEAKGEIIIWMSAHNTYEDDYIVKSVEALSDYGVDNVGGVILTVPRSSSLLGECIAAALSHPFGVGNSYFRIGQNKPRQVDTVFGGCYRKSIFSKIGGFNEELVRGQDLELNRRLIKSGGKILLVPDIKSYYYARSDLRSFWFHNWSNGEWAILPFMYSRIIPVSWRHLVPAVFTGTLVILSLASLYFPVARILLLSIVGIYIGSNLLASLQVAVKHHKFSMFFAMPVAFLTLHLGYGLGSLWGWVKASLYSFKVRFTKAGRARESLAYRKYDS